MKMRRMMVSPYEFGTAYSQYAWDAQDGVPFFEHFNYCNGHRKVRSYRVWEPGREAVSMPGYGQVEFGDSGAELPAVTTIHGIKGAAHFVLGAADDDLGTWHDDQDNILNVTDADAWSALTGDTTGSQNVDDAVENAFRRETERRAASIRIPLFAALYRGTYKAIDEDAGYEIDSGPGDDPDTLLEMDITSASTLESSRLDWWDLDWLTLPRATRTWNRVTNEGAEILEITHTNDAKGGWHKYALNLDANKTLGPDQVLWLHFMTGAIKLPVVNLVTVNGEPTRVLTCATYKNHRFFSSMQASMLVSRRITV